MKTVFRFFITTTAGVAAFATTTLAANGGDHSINGHIRTRFEYADNQGLTKTKWGEQFLQRARFSLNVSPTDTTSARITPEATYAWGSLENVTNGTTNAGGGGNNIDFSAKEAWMAWMPSDMVGVYVGRQVINFGDNVVFGGGDWQQTSLSHDAARLNFSYDMGKTSIFWTKMNERQLPTYSESDGDLFAMYTELNLEDYTEFVRGLDFHAWYYNDTGANPAAKTKYYGLGARAAGDIAMVFYDVDLAGQFGKYAGAKSQSGYMADLEAGVKFMDDRHSVAGNFVYANDEYRNLLGDIHGHLGDADIVGRNNVIALGLLTHFGLTDEFSAEVDGFYFVKAKKGSDHAAGAVWTGGLTGYGTSTSDTALGMEADFRINYQPEEQLNFELGYAFFSPGKALDNATTVQKETASKLYIQGVLSF